MNPQLSIITITFNDRDGLESTERSITAQTQQNFEWVVIDGDSTDGTKSYLQTNKRVTAYVSERDNGIYDAMKKGLKLARGEYVIFLNSGDTLQEPNCIAHFLNGPIKQSLDVYFFSTTVSGIFKTYTRFARDISYTKYSVPAIQQSTIYRRSVLDLVEWPNDLEICGDYSIAAQLYKQAVTSVSSDFVFSNFQLGGVSTNKYLRLSIEAFSIQRNYIKASLFFCYLTFFRRSFTGFVVWLAFKLRSKFHSTINKPSSIAD